MLNRFVQYIDAESVVELLVGYVPDLIAALVLAVVFWLVFIVSRKIVQKVLYKTHVQQNLKGLIQRFVKYGVVAFAILTIANQLGFNITALITGAGIAGLAISLAAQDTIANVLAGITISIDGLFAVGDWVRIGDVHAQVTTMKLRTTVLTTFVNETIVLPNRKIASEQIINYTKTDRIRVHVPVGIAYKEDIDAAREVMLATIENDSRVLDDPAPLVIVQELSSSSVNMEMRFWIEDPWKLFAMHWEYIERCKKALDRAGIEIPFPHMQMFLEKSQGLEMVSESFGK